MKKPHEQEWTLDRQMIVNEHGKGICRMQGSASTVEAETLILAAPDMARALLKEVSDHIQPCLCGKCAALRKAGVI